MRSLSIRQKLLLMTMISSLAALLLLTVTFSAYQYFVSRQQMKADLITLGRVIGDQMTASVTYKDKATARESLQTLIDKKQGIVAAGFYTPAGLFVSCLAPEHYEFRFPPAMQANGWQFGADRLTGFQHIYLNGEDIGAIFICSDLHDLHVQVLRYVVIMLLFALGALLAAYVFAARLQQTISRPILQLAQTAETVSREKNYAIRVPNGSNDEIGQLFEGFNGMLAQIQERDLALLRANEHLERRVEERTQDLQQQVSLLNEIIHAVATHQEIDGILQVVLQQLEDHLPVDYGSAYMFDEANDLLRMMARGPKTALLAERLGIPREIPITDTAFLACKRGKTVYVPDVGVSEASVARKIAGQGDYCCLGVPLASEGKTFGLLVLMRARKNGFTNAERDFIRGLSAHVALAIKQVRLYQDLEKAYNELRKSQQTVMQQERLKALGQMASGIAHDINNALSPIVGFSELLLKKKGFDAETKKYLDYIKAAGDDITHIVARLREFYRMRDDDESLQSLDLNQLASQAVGMATPRWRDLPKERGIAIEVKLECEPNIPGFAGVESEIREALLNLIINAVDALPNGGVITVRTRSSSYSGDVQDVYLEVCDTGVGMDEITRKRCLEPFFSTKGRRGSGLGLAMVYGIIERHHGSIEIESQLGKGSTFRLTFPARVADMPVFIDPETEMPIGPFRILCIDDEPTLRELLAKLLQSDGHKVETAENGHTGLAAFRLARLTRKPFDVVITDLGMPNMDGREVAARLKEESPDTPIIMLTGWGAFMQKSSTSSVDGVLSKPPHLHDLRMALREIVRARTARIRHEPITDTLISE